MLQGGFIIAFVVVTAGTSWRYETITISEMPT
jgi:hypothetical protein